MKKRQPSTSAQLAEFGVDVRKVPPVFREQMLAELKRQQKENEVQMALAQSEHERRLLHAFGQAFPQVGELLEQLLALDL
jgi:hypothetical protein